MLTSDPVAVEAAAIDDVRAFLRIDGASEDSEIARLIAAAIERCEAFVGEVLLRRGFAERIAPAAAWRALSAAPVCAILGIDAVAADGALSMLPGADYESDIDADGAGRVRFLVPVMATRASVRFEAGYAVEWDALPQGIRLGIARLVAEWRAGRDGADLPAAAIACWQPYRRMRLA